MSGEFDLDAPGLDLESQYIPAPKSAYRQVRKLESRHALVLEQRGRLNVERYWRRLRKQA